MASVKDVFQKALERCVFTVFCGVCHLKGGFSAALPGVQEQAQAVSFRPVEAEGGFSVFPGVLLDGGLGGRTHGGDLQCEVHLGARGGNYVVLFGGGAGGEDSGQGEDVYNVSMHRTFYMNWMQRYALFSIPACGGKKKSAPPGGRC